jgi:hypothetical protein
MINENHLSLGSIPDVMYLCFGLYCIITIADEIGMSRSIVSVIIPSFMKYYKLFSCILSELLV